MAFAHPTGLTCGAFEQRFRPRGGEFDRRKKEKFKCPGVCPGGGMLMLQIDRCIMRGYILQTNTKITYKREKKSSKQQQQQQHQHQQKCYKSSGRQVYIQFEVTA